MFSFITLCFMQVVYAQTTPESLFNDAPSFLKVDEAFGFDFEQQGDQLIIKWDIADGYYLYKKQFKTVSKNATLGEARFPAHEQIEDEFFGLSDVFFDDINMVYPIVQAKQDSSIKIRYQGCAKAGLCYPPTTKVVFLDAFDSGYLTPEQAFEINIKSDKAGDTVSQINVTINIADGYYILANEFSIDSFTHEFAQPSINGDSQALASGTEKAFFNTVNLSYSVLSYDQETQAPPIIEFTYKGCANDMLCYQAQTSEFNINEEHNTANSSQSTLADNSSPVSEQYTLAEQLLSDQSIAIKLSLLALLGLGLAFTPCVYPMYPILSSIVIGKGKKEIKMSQAFTLSFVYVQGMAITYSIIGLIVASVGVQFQAALQHPILLGIFIVLFIVLALGMFGLYEIQLPSKWQNKLNSLSDGQKQGNYVGVFIMGVVSGLVASPCTTAPLTAVLIVVAQSDSLLFGFSALYALSLGMGIPLILFGMTGGKLLPKAGAWMNVVKVTFGFMMLTVAILFIERFIVALWTDLLWALLGLSLFTYWFTVNQSTLTTLAKGIRTLITLSGLVVSIIFTIQTLQKLDTIPTLLATSDSPGLSQNNQANTYEHPEFMVVKSLPDFNTKLAASNAQGKVVMLDLYADWCVACKEFEKYTFPNPAVIDALSHAVWMQIDLTDNTPENLAFQEEFKVVGLPTIMFFDVSGKELTRSRVTGFMKAEAFAKHANNTLPKN